jgi:hypothetical protein
MKQLIPTYHAQNIYEVPVDFFAKVGIKNILLDLDNTLAGHNVLVADDRAKNYVSQLLAKGFNIIIVSNNRGPRVSQYAQSLGVEYRANMRKPLKKRFVRILSEKKFEKNATILVGDQLFTDVFVANRVGIRSMLVEKLVDNDQWTTRFNRMFETPQRKRLKRHNHLKNWREFYGTK